MLKQIFCILLNFEIKIFIIRRILSKKITHNFYIMSDKNFKILYIVIKDKKRAFGHGESLTSYRAGKCYNILTLNYIL